MDKVGICSNCCGLVVREVTGKMWCTKCHIYVPESYLTTIDTDNTRTICPSNFTDNALDKLMESGRRLRELLNITKEDTDRVLKEIREEWE